MRAPRRLQPPSIDRAALAAYAVLLILRAPRIWSGRFWAEEGSVFFAAAWSNGLPGSLVLPQLGYYAAVASLATTLAARAAPLEIAPLVTTAIAAGVQLIPAFLLVFSKIDALPDPRSRALALALLLFALPSEEIWLNSANSSHYLAACAGILLIARPAAASGLSLQCALLLLAGLSGVDANLLAPFFWWRVWRERSRARALQATALTVTAALQALIVLIAPAWGFAPVSVAGPRSPRLDLPALAHAILAKDVLLPLAGRAFTEGAMAPLAKLLAAHQPLLLVAAIALAWAAALAFAALRSRRWEPSLLLLAGLTLVFVSFTASVEAAQPSWHLTHATALGAGRYYFVPNFWMGLSLLMIASSASALPRRARHAGLALVIWMLAIGANEFFRGDARPWFFTGPSWRPQVAAWRRGETRELAIWPAPWKIALERRPPGAR